MNDIKERVDNLVIGVRLNNKMNWDDHRSIMVMVMNGIKVKLGGLVSICKADDPFTFSGSSVDGYAIFEPSVLGEVEHIVYSMLRVTMDIDNVTVMVAVPMKYEVKANNDEVMTILSIDSDKHGSGGYVVTHQQGLETVVCDIVDYVCYMIEYHSGDKASVCFTGL